MNKQTGRSFPYFENHCTKYSILHIGLLLLTSLLIPERNIAQSLGNWTFNGVLTGTPGAHNTVSTADFSAGVPIHSFNGGTEYYGENGWPSGSINTAMYLQFSLTPNSGYQLDITSLVVTIRRSNTGTPPGSGPTSWSLRSSLDGFTTDISSGSMTLTYGSFTVTPGSSFLNLYSTVTFRLYGYNASSGSGGNSRFVVDNVTANGVGYLLPITLGNLHADLQNEKANLSYIVYNTEKNSHYVIERSTDGIHYAAIHSTEEIAEEAQKEYGYTDDVQALYGVSQLFYRICTMSNSGGTVYSNSVMLKRKETDTQIKVFIKNNQAYINGTFPADGIYRAIIYSTSGQVLNAVSFNATSGYNSLILPLNKTVPLVYVIRLVSNKGCVSSVMQGLFYH